MKRNNGQNNHFKEKKRKKEGFLVHQLQINVYLQQN
jgi:hypothetical protein